MACILMVEDDPDIRKIVSYNLSNAGHDVKSASTGREAIRIVDALAPDLVVLDLMLPDIDGKEVCRTLRRSPTLRRVPVLMLTARADEIDRVVGFEIGADDYVAKPFSPRELVLRVNALLRRSTRDPAPALRAGLIELHPARRQCGVDGAPVTLTAKEFDLLLELLKAEGDVVTREVLMDRVWGYHGDAESRTLDTHVRRVREKLGKAGRLVETVRGIGYRIDRG